MYYIQCMVDICNCKKFNQVGTIAHGERCGEFGDGIN